MEHGCIDGMAQGWIDGVEHGYTDGMAHRYTSGIAHGFATGQPWKRRLKVDLSCGNHSWQHCSNTLLLPAARGIPRLGSTAGFRLLTDALQAHPSLQATSQNSQGSKILA